jgi:hypothetical protein
MDIMFVNGLPLLTTINDTIKYQSVVPIMSRHSRVVYSALDTITRVNYNKTSFTITTIHCDQEFKFMMDQISDDLDIEMKYTTTGDHVPEAERNNCTLKERIRAIY